MKLKKTIDIWGKSEYMTSSPREGYMAVFMDKLRVF
jgi:hypothetical protein